MKKQKLVSAVLCAAMAGTLLSGCGGSDTGTAAGDQGGGTQETGSQATSETGGSAGTETTQAAGGIVTEPTELRGRRRGSQGFHE